MTLVGNFFAFHFLGSPMPRGRSSFRESRSKLVIHHIQQPHPPPFNRGDLGASLPKPPPPPLASKSRLRPTLLGEYSDLSLERPKQSDDQVTTKMAELTKRYT